MESELHRLNPATSHTHAGHGAVACQRLSELAPAVGPQLRAGRVQREPARRGRSGARREPRHEGGHAVALSEVNCDGCRRLVWQGARAKVGEVEVHGASEKAWAGAVSNARCVVTAALLKNTAPSRACAHSGQLMLLIVSAGRSRRQQRQQTPTVELVPL